MFFNLKSNFSKYLKKFLKEGGISEKKNVLNYHKNKKIPSNKKYELILGTELIGYVEDVQTEVEKIRKYIKDDGILIITSINPFWGQTFSFNNKKTPLLYLWFIENIIDISGFEVIKSGYKIFLPFNSLFISWLLNLIIPRIPKLNRFCPFQYVYAKPKCKMTPKKYFVSVIIPCFNEQDNIAECIKQVPKMGKFTEIIISDDGSTDNTVKIARSYQSKYRNLKVISYQPNRGKVWAVKAGFENANGDLVMVWDADRTVPADELPRFYKLFSEGQAEYAHGTRVAYPMEKQAMKTANLMGNLFFGWIYSWILETRVTDTLCGTKVIFKKDFKKMKIGTEPWGDFDLLFGAKKLGLKIKEIPVHYKARVAGKSKMKTFKYGMVVAKMAFKAFLTFKVFPFFKKPKIDLLLVIILLIAFLVRFIGLIPNLSYHPDEAYIQKASKELFENIITKGDFEPKAYKYGSIVFYLQSLVYFPFFILTYLLKTLSFISSNPSNSNKDFLAFFEKIIYNFRDTIFYISRGTTAIFGILSVYVLYLISKKLLNRLVALIAALILALAPSHVRSSHWITTDILSLFTILLAIYFMVLILEKRDLKWYIIAGFFIGVSSSIRYFPIALLVYPIVCLLSFQKKRSWLINCFLGFLFVPVGFVFSTPFLLFSKQSQTIFQREMVNDVLPFYGTSATAYVTKLAQFLISLGKQSFPDINSLYPNKFVPFYSSFLIFKGYGLVASIAALLGLPILIFKYPRQFLLLVIIPLVTWIYISYYLHSIYDRLIIPILPFMAISSAVFVTTLWQVFKKYLPQSIATTSTMLILVALLYYPFTESFSSSFACSKPDIYKQAELWIDENIKEGSKIVQIPLFMYPSKSYDLIETSPNRDFFMQEIQNLGYDYFFVNDSRLAYNLYPFVTDFFTQPKYMYENSFINLAMKEYLARANLLKLIKRPMMCHDAKLYMFKVPAPIKEAKHLIKKYSFENQSDFVEWKLDRFGIKNNIVEIKQNSQESYEGKNSLEYQWVNIAYTGPRAMSSPININGGKVYTFSGWIKADQKYEEGVRDGFLRLDFYDNNQKDFRLPGSVVALSARNLGDPKWRKFSITAKAPNNTTVAILSLQLAGAKTGGSLYFDDLELLDL